MNFTQESIEALPSIQAKLAALSFFKNMVLSKYDAEGKELGAYELYPKGYEMFSGTLHISTNSSNGVR